MVNKNKNKSTLVNLFHLKNKDLICLSNNSLDMGYLAVDLPNDVYSDESVYTTPSFQGDIINSSLDNSPISRCFSEPCTPNSDQEWKGCRDEIEGKAVSNKVVKRLKKPAKKPKKKPENSITNEILMNDVIIFFASERLSACMGIFEGFVEK